ncbi:hypothetical protein LTR49_026809 [Elasticomyces elasticus]|nr:hypothetical protein LTR49_026809 [Elasticomyces elasticus]
MTEIYHSVGIKCERGRLSGDPVDVECMVKLERARIRTREKHAQPLDAVISNRVLLHEAKKVADKLGDVIWPTKEMYLGGVRPKWLAEPGSEDMKGLYPQDLDYVNNKETYTTLGRVLPVRCELYQPESLMAKRKRYPEVYNKRECTSSPSPGSSEAAAADSSADESPGAANAPPVPYTVVEECEPSSKRWKHADYVRVPRSFVVASG